MTDTLTLIRPDDWHIHLRDGNALARTVPDAARSFGRVIAMPNLVPPVGNTAEAMAYRERILAHLPAGSTFQPLMVLYLTDNTDPQEIAHAKASGHVVACKLYPAGATTNAESGVTNIRKIYPVLEAMQKAGIAFLVHGEVTDADTDIFDREKIFLTEVLSPVLHDFPELKTVVEHITTREAVHFVSAAPAHVGATITAHHLLFNRNHMLAGGIRPHYYCLPILKRNIHQEALIQAATGGNPKFFLGTDSAPHAQHKKENACGCAGCYTASHALELYAEAFDRACALHRLEAFASLHGADFYGVPRNTTRVTLRKQAWQVPATLSFSDSTLVPLLAGETLHWQLTP